MGLFRIRKLRLTSDKCAEELYNVVFWVQSYFKSALIEDNEELDETQLVQLISDRSYEMLLLSLWVMHTYLPSERLRDKICKKFFKAVRSGSSDIGRSISLEEFQQDLENRLKVYSDAYDKLRFFPNVGVNEFGGMIAQVIQYGNLPSEQPTKITPDEVSKWYFRARVAINKWHNEIKRRQLVTTIEKYSDPNQSHL